MGNWHTCISVNLLYVETSFFHKKTPIINLLKDTQSYIFKIIILHKIFAIRSWTSIIIQDTLWTVIMVWIRRAECEKCFTLVGAKFSTNETFILYKEFLSNYWHYIQKSIWWEEMQMGSFLIFFSYM